MNILLFVPRTRHKQTFFTADYLTFTLLWLFLSLLTAFTHASWYEREPRQQRYHQAQPQSWSFLGLSHLYDYASSWLGSRGSSRIGRSDDPYFNRQRNNINRQRDPRLLRPYAQRQQAAALSTDAANLPAATRVIKSLHSVRGEVGPPPSNQIPTRLLLPDNNNKLGMVDGVENNEDELNYLDGVDYSDEHAIENHQWPSSSSSMRPNNDAQTTTTTTSLVDPQQQQHIIDDGLRQFHHTRLCNMFLNKVPRQYELCLANAEVFWRIREAAQLAVGECKRQFQNERWNCSTSDPLRLFGQTLKRSSKEEAFVSAISSAAVVHSVVKACSSGNLSFCGCDNARQGQYHAEGWRWGGCTDNLRIGEAFAEAFVDAPQKAIGPRKGLEIYDQIDLHNNAAGRMIIKKHMQRHCRCHGVSGSCEMRTCWEQMPSFQQIGRYLKAKYDKSIRVGKRFNKKLRRRGRAERFKPIQDDELVYLRRSPNYCDADAQRGIFGTQGRVCNRTSTGPDSCNQMCCGRGYATRVEKRIHRCDCKFVWCCEVRCKTCVTETEVFVCM